MGRPFVLRSLSCVLPISLIVIATAKDGHAQSLPHTLNHQGRAYDGSMMPLTGTHMFRFSVYNVSIGGTALWTEVHNLALVDGYYSAELGRETMLPESVFTSSTTIFLGIALDSDSEMTPRQPVDSVPYALLADNVVGDISPHTVSVGGMLVINDKGEWVGPSANISGPQGPAG